MIQRWFPVLLFAAAFPAQSADIVFNVAGTGQIHRIPYASIARMSPTSGDIVVKPLAAAGVAGDGWCPPSGGVAAANGPSVVLQLAGGVLYRIPIASGSRLTTANGDIEVTTLGQSGVAGDAWCSGNGAGDPPPIFANMFVVNPSSLPYGPGTITLYWKVNEATSCIASSTPSVPGWNGAVATTGPVQVALPTNATYSLSLTCSDANASVSATRTVVVTAAPSPGNCSGRTPPPGLTRQTSMINYSGYNINFPLGGTIPLNGYSPIFGPTFSALGTTASVLIDSDKYVALQFNTGTQPTGAYGEFRWEMNNGTAPLWVMISRCPGDFSSVTDATCKLHAGFGALSWVIGPAGTEPTWACHLQPNTEYFVNAAFVSASDFSTSTCQGSPCRWWVIGVGRQN